MNTSARQALRMKFGGKCAYCGCELPEKGWHADHVEPVRREWWKNTEWWKKDPMVWVLDPETDTMIHRRATEQEMKPGFEHPELDTEDNYFPSCRACNIDKHATTLEDWRKQMQDRVGVCRRNYSAFRHAERFGLIQEIKKPIIFWFEKFNSSAQFPLGTSTDLGGEEPTTDSSRSGEPVATKDFSEG